MSEISQQEAEESAAPAGSPKQEPKIILHADSLIDVIARTIVSVETKYVITPANLRGAFTTMLRKLDKET